MSTLRRTARDEPNVERQIRLHTNLSLTQRAVSVVIGLGKAAAAALSCPNELLSLAAFVAGAGLGLRGASGYRSMKAALQNA